MNLQFCFPPVIRLHTHLLAQMAKKLCGVRDLLPHLRKEGGAPMNISKDDSIHMRMQLLEKVFARRIFQRKRSGQSRNLKLDPAQFIFPHWRKTRVMQRGRDCMFTYIFGKRLKGFQRTDTWDKIEIDGKQRRVIRLERPLRAPNSSRGT